MKKSRQKTTLYIKNMVCDRCIRVVQEELTKQGYGVSAISLGMVEIVSDREINIRSIQSILSQNGFELIEDKRGRIVEEVKRVIIDLVHRSNRLEDLNEKYSEYIAKQVKQDYLTLSKLFSAVTNTTIEKYLIQQKIERVKELMVYGELSLSEIAFQLGYSSVQHLSNQFKHLTGLSPSHYKHIKQNKRISIDKIG